MIATVQLTTAPMVELTGLGPHPEIFALNMWLQDRRVGRRRSYVFGERAHLMLSLVAKSALAWQMLPGTLAG